MHVEHQIVRSIFKRIVPPAVPISRYFRCALRDGLDRVLFRRKHLIPPTRWLFDGSHDPVAYEKDGQEFMGYFVRYCDLKPSERVLDMGCGIGRKAVQLVRYLDESGSYEGFDVVSLGIRWCTKVVGRYHLSFRFHHCDVFNPVYNPKGSISGSQYRFPFEDESFDFAFSGSLFTHALPEVVDNYFAEMARVIRPHGRCLNTFFLYNEESSELMKRGKSTMDFRYDFGVYRSGSAERREDAICYDEEFVLGLHKKHGLLARQPILYGSWCDRVNSISIQDMIIADKLPSNPQRLGKL